MLSDELAEKLRLRLAVSEGLLTLPAVQPGLPRRGGTTPNSWDQACRRLIELQALDVLPPEALAFGDETPKSPQCEASPLRIARADSPKKAKGVPAMAVVLGRSQSMELATDAMPTVPQRRLRSALLDLDAERAKYFKVQESCRKESERASALEHELDDMRRLLQHEEATVRTLEERDQQQTRELRELQFEAASFRKCTAQCGDAKLCQLEHEEHLEIQELDLAEVVGHSCEREASEEFLVAAAVPSHEQEAREQLDVDAVAGPSFGRWASEEDERAGHTELRMQLRRAEESLQAERTSRCELDAETRINAARLEDWELKVEQFAKRLRAERERSRALEEDARKASGSLRSLQQDLCRITQENVILRCQAGSAVPRLEPGCSPPAARSVSKPVRVASVKAEGQDHARQFLLGVGDCTLWPACVPRFPDTSSCY